MATIDEIIDHRLKIAEGRALYEAEGALDELKDIIKRIKGGKSVSFHSRNFDINELTNQLTIINELHQTRVDLTKTEGGL